MTAADRDELAERFANQAATRHAVLDAMVADELRATPCRSGCATRDHESYAECLKAAAVQIGKLR